MGLSIFGEHGGATIYVPTTSRSEEIEFISAQENALRNGTSPNTELEKTCGAHFICHWDSDVREVAVVYNNFEEGEKTAAGYDSLQNRRIPWNAFKILKVITSTPTEDGLGVKLHLATENDNVSKEQDDVDNRTKYPLVAVTRTRRSRLDKKKKKLTESKSVQELFKERLQFHQARFYNICDGNDRTPYIRCSHWYHERRTLAFASVFFETRLGRSRKAIVAVLWYTTTRPHRAVCVSLSRRNTSVEGQNDVEHVVQLQLVATCSCCPMLSQMFGRKFDCYHAQICLEDQSFRAMVNSEIRRRESISDLQDRGDTIFGQCVTDDTSIRSPSSLTVVLDRATSTTRTLASLWIFFMIFEPDLLLFVPVCNIKRKPLRCFICRIPLSRRGVCAHEENAKIAAKASLRRSNCTSALLLELAIMDDDGSTDTERSIQEQGEADGNNVLDEHTSVQRSMTLAQTFTPIDVRCPILPCRGEWNDMINIEQALNTARDNDVLVLDERAEAKCHKCGQSQNGQHHKGYARNVYLFSLNRDSYRIRVYD